MSSERPSANRSPEEFLNELKELVAANLAGNARLLGRFNDLLRIASQTLARGTPSGRQDPAAALSRWLEFNLASYAVVSSHSLALMEGLLGVAEKALVSEAPRSASAPDRRLELRMAARPGEVATTAFLVENHFDHEIKVTCVASDLVAPGGGRISGKTVAFEPNQMTLAPRSQSMVQAALTLGRSVAVGESYSGTIRVMGLKAGELGLTVTVLPPGDHQPAARPKAKSARQKGKRK